MYKHCDFNYHSAHNGKEGGILPHEATNLVDLVPRAV